MQRIVDISFINASSRSVRFHVLQMSKKNGSRLSGRSCYRRLNYSPRLLKFLEVLLNLVTLCSD